MTRLSTVPRKAQINTAFAKASPWQANEHKPRKRLPANHPPSLQLRRGARGIHAKIRLGVSYLFHLRLFASFAGRCASSHIRVHSYSFVVSTHWAPHKIRKTTQRNVDTCPACRLRGTAQHPPQIQMQKQSRPHSGFLTLRALVALVLCIAACSIVTGTLLAFFRSDALTTVSLQRTLTFAERVAYQRAIE